jgi:hypothetical protein
VDSEEKEEEEVWVKVEDRSSIITAHNQDTWKGTVRTLLPLPTTATHSNMSHKIVLCHYKNFRRNEDETKKYN